MTKRMKYEKHPSGHIVNFNKKNHTYFIQGMPNLKFISGTQLVNKYFPKFDSFKVSELYAKKYNLDPVQVRKGWEEKGRKARERGNKYHSYAEELLRNNHSIVNSKDDIMRAIEGKLKDLFKKNFKPVCAECIIACLDLQVAGSVDLIMSREDTLLIADWKFTEDLKYENPYKYDNTALDPISHIPNTNYYQYVLQLSLYKYIIKREGYFPDLNKHKIQIFHVNDSGLRTIEVPDFTVEIKNMIADYNESKNNLNS